MRWNCMRHSVWEWWKLSERWVEASYFYMLKTMWEARLSLSIYNVRNYIWGEIINVRTYMRGEFSNAANIVWGVFEKIRNDMRGQN